jgi:hypothetical protein
MEDITENLYGNDGSGPCSPPAGAVRISGFQNDNERLPHNKQAKRKSKHNALAPVSQTTPSNPKSKPNTTAARPNAKNLFTPVTSIKLHLLSKI